VSDNRDIRKADGSEVQVRSWRIWLERLGPFLALIIITIGFAAADQIWGRGKLLEIRNVRFMLVTAAPLAVAALGMMLVIMTGGIDLSAGTLSALCATVLALAIKLDYSMPVAVSLAVLVGMFCGSLNGLFIGILRIPPFIVTLGTMTVFLGAGKLLSGSTTIFIDSRMLPQWLQSFVSILPPHWIGNTWLPNIPMGVWVAIGLSVVTAVVLSRTVFGRHIKAVGSNEATARLCGVNVFKTKLSVYALAGALFGVAGLYSFALMSMANPTEGTGKELKFIAAVVIGGGSLSGGRGSVAGTLAGAAITVILISGCSQLGASNAMQDIITGIIIIAAVVIDQLRHRKVS
jgi:ribose transport system permease protein